MDFTSLTLVMGQLHGQVKWMSSQVNLSFAGYQIQCSVFLCFVLVGFFICCSWKYEEGRNHGAANDKCESPVTSLGPECQPCSTSF